MAESFSIRRTACFVESDRLTVFKNVSALMRDYGYVDAGATEAECLDAFDIMVQQLVPLYLEASFGRCGLPWRLAFGLYPVFLGFGLDIVSSENVNNRRGHGARFWVLTVLFWLIFLGALVPLWLAFASWLSSRCLSLRRLKRWMFMFVGWQVVVFTYLSLFVGYVYIWDCAARGGSPLWIAAFIVVSIISVLVSIAVFREVQIPAEQWAQRQLSCRRKTRMVMKLGDAGASTDVAQLQAQRQHTRSTFSSTLGFKLERTTI